MSTTRKRARRHRRIALAAALVAVAFALAVPAPALAAPPRNQCPAAYPLDQIQEGMRATGWTVERGNSIQKFDVEVIGVYADGIAPGIDMIMVEAKSAAITRAGGIWAGMSGSPVYARDGRLLGAVAYGLAAQASPIAGLTPASAMYEILGFPRNDDPPSTDPAEEDENGRVRLTKDLQSKVAAAAGVTAKAAGQGLSQLDMPLGVSGLTSDRLDEFQTQLSNAGIHGRAYRAGSAKAGEEGDVTQIKPGSNFATALASGDASMVGTGTTTALCENGTLAFGHPMQMAGQTAIGTHTATAVYVQPDSIAGPPFKVSNPGGVVGTLDQDRLAGVRSQLGQIPASFPVTTKMEARGTGLSREGLSRVYTPKVAGLATFLQMMGNLDRVYQRHGEGSVTLNLSARGHNGQGEPWQINRVGEVIAHRSDVGYAASVKTAITFDLLGMNEFSEVSYDSIAVSLVARDQYRQYDIGEIRQLVGSEWVVVDGTHPITGPRGGFGHLKVHLLPWRGLGTATDVEMDFQVPWNATSMSSIRIFGGLNAFDLPVGATSFADYISKVQNAAKQNNVIVELSASPPIPGQPVTPPQRWMSSVDQVVGGQISIPAIFS